MKYGFRLKCFIDSITIVSKTLMESWTESSESIESNNLPWAYVAFPRRSSATTHARSFSESQLRSMLSRQYFLSLIISGLIQCLAVYSHSCVVASTGTVPGGTCTLLVPNSLRIENTTNIHFHFVVRSSSS